jgi:hypothetical protein
MATVYLFYILNLSALCYNSIRILLFSSLISFVGISQAVFAVFVRYHHPQTGQIIEMFGDTHFKYIESDKQKNFFIQGVKKRQKEGDCLVIVEDALNPELSLSEDVKLSPDERLLLELERSEILNIRYTDGLHNQVLIGLLKECRDNGIPCVNVEFRRIINEQSDNPSAYSLWGYYVKEILSCCENGLITKEFVDFIKESSRLALLVSSEIAGDSFRIISTETKAKILRSVELERQPDNVSLDVVLSDQKLIERSFADIRQRAEARFLDARIAYQIALNPDKRIFVCAGVHHIERLNELMEALGYRKTCHYDYRILPNRANNKRLFSRQLKLRVPLNRVDPQLRILKGAGGGSYVPVNFDLIFNEGSHPLFPRQQPNLMALFGKTVFTEQKEEEKKESD